MISRLRSRSLFPAAMPPILPSRPTAVGRCTGVSTYGSGRPEDVDHEDQRGVLRDPAVGLAVGAVPELRRDLQDDAGPDRHALQRLVPALDDGAGADAERGRLALAGVAEVLVE